MCEYGEFQEHADDLQSISDLCLAAPYLEFDPGCADEGLFSSSVFRENFNGFLPPPSKYSRSESTPFVQTEASCCRGAIVSLLKPHTILAVGPDILSLAGFNSEQMCGRSINVLFGPRTDVASLNAAIKNAGQNESSTIITILSSSTGADLHVTATLSPYHTLSDRSIGGCLLQIDCVHLPGMESAEPVFIMDGLSLLCDPPTPPPSRRPNLGWCPSDPSPEHEHVTQASDQSTSPQPSPKDQIRIRSMRREAKLAAGLENEAERRRQQQARLFPAREDEGQHGARGSSP